MLQVTMLGIDLGKNSCSLVGLDATGKVVVRRRMRRETVIAFCLKCPTCTIAMEACCGAHHMGRALAAQGHVIRLMSPEYGQGSNQSNTFMECTDQRYSVSLIFSERVSA